MKVTTNGKTYKVGKPLPGEIAPVHEGVYLRKFRHSFGFSYWDPKYGWGLSGSTPQLAEERRNIPSFCSNIPWYGLEARHD